MQKVGIFSGFILTLLIPVSVFAVPADNESLKQYCLDKLNLTIHEGEINFVYEREHDPSLHLVRRCITEERKKIITERKIERQKLRDTAHFRRSSNRLQVLREKVEGGINKAIRRKIIKGEQFRAPTRTLDRDAFNAGRRSRRSIIRDEEGIDRINAIRRKIMRSTLPDPCGSIGVINQNTTCGNPTRYYQLKEKATAEWYRRR